MYSIAKLKQKENISEFLLFLWQMEDLLRGIEFDMSRLDAEILPAIIDDNERLRISRAAFVTDRLRRPVRPCQRVASLSLNA